MGLFIGASILTVLEILDYIYEVREVASDRGLRQLAGSRRKENPNVPLPELQEFIL